jgi:predicted CopG family antitoxin
MHMVKVISISEEAYRRMRLLKKEGMSFSDVIISSVETGNEEKTEGWAELLKWIGGLPGRSRKKERISENVDRIAYGVSR